MADNSSDILVKSLANNAQAGLAKYGGYGKSSGWGNAINLALQGLAAAFPQSPLFAGGNAINQAVNVSKYNQYLVQQAQQAQELAKQANQNNAKVYTDTTGLSIQNPDAGFDTGFVGGAMPQIRKNNANPAWQQVLNGETVTMDDNKADYGDLPSKLLERANAINDANATGAKLKEWMQANLPGLAVTGGTQVQTLGGTAQMDNTTPLQASASKQQPITPGEAAQYGIPDWSTVLTGRKNEQDDRLGNRKQTETERSNLVEEALKKVLQQSQINDNNASADLKRRTNPNLRSGGGSENPYTIPNAQQNYLEGQLKAIEKQMSDNGFMDKNGNVKAPSEMNPSHYELPGGLFGLQWGHDAGNPSQKARFNSLNSQRDQILGALSGNMPSGGAFGGKSKANLQNLSKSIYPGRGK